MTAISFPPSSDEALKTEVENISAEACRQFVDAFAAKSYTRIDTGLRETGFIAQEVQQIMPQWVGQGDDGYLYLNPIGYEAMVVDAIQELRAEKDAQISSLQAENDELRARLESIERTVMTLLQD